MQTLPDAVEKIVIRTPNWLGDLMMSTAFIRAVLKKYPHSVVDLIVKKGFESLPLPHRGKILPFDKNNEKPGHFGRSLRGHGYDLFFVLPPSFSSAWMSLQSKVPVRVGYRESFRSWFLNPAIRYREKPRSRHLVQEYLDLLDPTLTPQEHLPELDISSSWIETQLDKKKNILPKKFIAIAPGAIYGPAKQWPVEHFHRLSHLFQQKGKPVVILGTEKDRNQGEEIINGLELSKNLCGQTSLTELVAILAKAELLVSNDSGAMHIMTALQLPQIALFGSSSPSWTGPVNPNAETLYLNLSCSPCFSRTCKFGHYNCLKDISPDSVFQKA